MTEILASWRVLKTSQSPEAGGIQPAILKEMAKAITESLVMLLKHLLEAGKLPAELRTAVCSLFKGGSRGDLINYRPIKLACGRCKVSARLAVVCKTAWTVLSYVPRIRLPSTQI